MLITPETTPPSIPTNSATAPSIHRKLYRPVASEPSETAESVKQRSRRIDLRILMATPKSEDAKQMQRDLQRLETHP
jgi:hypothetical protein